MAKQVRKIGFAAERHKDQEVLDLVNQVAPLLNRDPNDAARFLLVRAIREYLREHKQDGQAAVAV